MAIHGPDPLHTDAASFVLGETLVALQRRIRDDLTASQSDRCLERPVLGALLCIRAIVEAFPDHGFHCHTEDIQEWRGQYLAWLDANLPRIKLKSGDKKLLRQHAVSEFDRVEKLSDGSAYRLDEE
ncbi:MAG TPA: hypothetical protein VM533_18585 [Fimbriiglobus sp.]|jgi:hypothetical protein|nr:hypothetical protein [Fimbriiglobus sp.]